MTAAFRDVSAALTGHLHQPWACYTIAFHLYVHEKGSFTSGILVQKNMVLITTVLHFILLSCLLCAGDCLQTV